MLTTRYPLTIRGGGDPRQAWLARRLREWACRLGALPLMRMTASWSGSASDPPNTSVWRDRSRPWRAPLGSSARHLQADQTSEWLQERPASLSIVPSRAQASGRCETQAALKPAPAKAGAARRQAPPAFRSLDPLRALREPDRRRRDEERPSRSEQRTRPRAKKNKHRVDCPSHPGNVTVTIANRRSVCPDLESTPYR
jgi:hypothetical protein